MTASSFNGMRPMRKNDQVLLITVSRRDVEAIFPAGSPRAEAVWSRLVAREIGRLQRFGAVTRPEARAMLEALKQPALDPHPPVDLDIAELRRGRRRMAIVFVVGLIAVLGLLLFGGLL